MKWLDNLFFKLIEKGSGGKPTTTIELSVYKERLDEIQALAEQSGARSMIEFFSEAVTFYEWGLNETAQGNTVGAINSEFTSFHKAKFAPFERVLDSPQPLYEKTNPPTGHNPDAG